ncbi:hypothetical protein GDO81_017235 [Engystomops pustulosus]|uniref:Glutathione S-transferase LANCL1 n=1 Tax=Engystomops pustulosus TaxID=76066 RepID=A0AAV7AK71_ENGPU|nr:hypothetical protein GDO81_017235 [Engystomops pustulosus]
MSVAASRCELSPYCLLYAMDVRSFPNPYLYQDYTKDASVPFNAAGQLSPEFVYRLNGKIQELLQLMENGLKSADPGDFTVYTGWSGIALLYLHLSEVYREQSFLLRAQEYASKALRSIQRRDVTFLCGQAGPYAVAAVILYKLGSHKEADECISRVLQMHSAVLKLDSRLPDELLYGRMGYLYTLLFINKYYNGEKVPYRCIQEVCEVVIRSGENFAVHKRMKNLSPLLYEWYGEYYVGPAHGLAGIYYYLMQIFQHSEYLAEAAQCAEISWQRGLLKKGYGLCHGAAGNAYSFLAMYNLTHDLKYLYRACKFAEWCMDYGHHGCRTPDTPFSLFEGLAGTIYFLADLMDPAKAKFPAFEI